MKTSKNQLTSRTLWERLGTKLIFSTSCHPQTDAQIKVVNNSLSTMIRSIMKGNHKSWDEYFPHIEFACNRVVHKTTNISPFEFVYGFNPHTPLDLYLYLIHMNLCIRKK